MKRKAILKVIREGGKWIVRSNRMIDGFTVDDTCKSKSQAVTRAYKYAARLKPALVKIFTVAGKLQINYEVN